MMKMTFKRLKILIALDNHKVLHYEKNIDSDFLVDEIQECLESIMTGINHMQKTGTVRSDITVVEDESI